jgi:hypothetical protein
VQLDKVELIIYVWNINADPKVSLIGLIPSKIFIPTLDLRHQFLLANVIVIIIETVLILIHERIVSNLIFFNIAIDSDVTDTQEDNADNGTKKANGENKCGSNDVIIVDDKQHHYPNNQQGQTNPKQHIIFSFQIIPSSVSSLTASPYVSAVQ